MHESFRHAGGALVLGPKSNIESGRLGDNDASEPNVGYQGVPMILRKAIAVVGAALLLVMTIAQPAGAAVNFDRAELKNGDEIRLDGGGAIAGATIFIDGLAWGTADDAGEF